MSVSWTASWLKALDCVLAHLRGSAAPFDTEAAKRIAEAERMHGRAEMRLLFAENRASRGTHG